jgi:hypothetical protein
LHYALKMYNIEDWMMNEYLNNPHTCIYYMSNLDAWICYMTLSIQKSQFLQQFNFFKKIFFNRHASPSIISDWFFRGWLNYHQQDITSSHAAHEHLMRKIFEKNKFLQAHFKWMNIKGSADTPLMIVLWQISNFLNESC